MWLAAVDALARTFLYLMALPFCKAQRSWLARLVPKTLISPPAANHPSNYIGWFFRRVRVNTQTSYISAMNAGHKVKPAKILDVDGIAFNHWIKAAQVVHTF